MDVAPEIPTASPRSTKIVDIIWRLPFICGIAEVSPGGAVPFLPLASFAGAESLCRRGHSHPPQPSRDDRNARGSVHRLYDVENIVRVLEKYEGSKKLELTQSQRSALLSRTSASLLV